MRMVTRSVLIAPVLIAVMAGSFAFAQSTSSSTDTNQTTADRRHETIKAKAAAVAAAAATPDPSPEPDFWRQETMTGDWGGTRSRWKEKGIELEFKYVGIFQTIASGGTDDKSSLTNKLETTWKFDLAKVAGWKYWSSEIKAEWRFGGPALTGTGGINFTNTAGIIPGASGSVVSVTAVNFTRIIPKDLQKGDLYIVSFGRYNLLDLLDEDFFAGSGVERFMNIAPNWTINRFAAGSTNNKRRDVCHS